MKPCKRGHTGGRTARRQCIECMRLAYDPKRKQTWRLKNIERAREIERENARAWRLANPEKARQQTRKARGIPEPTRPMPPECECCGRPPRGKDKVLAADHDHATGLFRGWLCNSCNSGLGLLGDTLASVDKMRSYLQRHS